MLSRVLGRLEISDVLLAQTVDDLLSLLQVRKSLVQLGLGFLLDDLHFFCFEGDLGGFLLRLLFILLCLDLVLRDKIFLLLGALGLLIELGSQIGQSHLQLFNLLSRALQIIYARGQAFDL